MQHVASKLVVFWILTIYLQRTYNSTDWCTNKAVWTNVTNVVAVAVEYPRRIYGSKKIELAHSQCSQFRCKQQRVRLPVADISDLMLEKLKRNYIFHI